MTGNTEDDFKQAGTQDKIAERHRLYCLKITGDSPGTHDDNLWDNADTTCLVSIMFGDDSVNHGRSNYYITA